MKRVSNKTRRDVRNQNHESIRINAHGESGNQIIRGKYGIPIFAYLRVFAASRENCFFSDVLAQHTPVEGPPICAIS